jgi:hypothetical protein
MTAIANAAPIAAHAIASSPTRLAAWITRLGAILRQLGPYAAVEILLPGGTLMALLLWLYRRRRTDQHLAIAATPGIFYLIRSSIVGR